MRRSDLEHIIGAAANVAGVAEFVRVDVPPRPGSTGQPAALCLEPHDLVLAKCAAGRERDWEFAREAITAGLVARDELRRRIDLMPIDEARRIEVRKRLDAIGASD